MKTFKMPTSIGRLVFSFSALFICMHSVKCDKIPDEPTCVFSVPNNKTLFQKLAKYFDKDSNTIIVEYTVRIRNVSDDFNFYEKSNPGSFQPWKWYRTQGVGSSHVLLTFDFCFGLLRQLLYLGIEKVDLDLDVSPPGCLHHIENKTLDILIRNFLLKEFYILDTSFFGDCTFSDSIEICTARIREYEGRGKLMFRCCSYNSDKEIVCDDDYVDDWAQALNIVICILSCLLVLYYILLLLHYNGFLFNKKDTYIFNGNYSILLYLKMSNNIQNILSIPQKTMKGMKEFNKKLKDTDANEIYKVTVKNTSVKVPCHRLLNEYDDLDSWLIAWKKLLLPGCCCYCRLKDEEANEKCSKLCLKFSRTSSFMIILILTSTWLICAMRNPNFWYQELVDAFSARGLQGPFYFQWGADLKVQYGTAITLLVLNVIGAAVIIVRDTLRDSPKPLNYISYFFYVFFLFASLLDAILLISLFVMLIFTVIVQVQIWNLVVQVFLTLLVYARVYFQELWSDRIALKSLLLKLFKLESQFNGESSVSTITAESLDNAFEKLKNDYNCGQASGSNSGIKLTADENSLKLQLNGTLIFLNKFDVPSITQNFYDHCLNLEFQGHKRCLWLRVLRFGKLCVWPPMMVSLVFISIMAYGDLYHISPSNRFFASFVAIIVPLVVQHFNPGGSSGKSINKYNRKLQRELREAINKYEEHLVVHDFTESVIRPATTEEKEDHLNSFCKVYTFRPEKSSNLVSVSAHAAKTSGAPLTSIPPRHPSEGSVPHEERQVPATEENEC